METYHVYKTRRLNVIKMPIIPKLTYRFSAVNQNSHSIFAEVDTLLLKFIRKFQEPRIPKAMFWIY